MPEDPQESAAEQQESVELPTPKISQASAGQQPSAKVADEEQLVAKLAEKLAPTIESYIERKVQSTKDRRFDGFARDIATIQEYLQQSGGDPRKAARELAIDQWLNQPQQVPQAQGKTWEDELREGSRKVLKAAEEEWGVKLSRDDIAELEDAEYETVADYYAEIQRRVAKKGKQSKSGPTTVVTEGGQKPAPTGNAEELAAKLSAATLRNAPTAEIKALRDALQEAYDREQ